jgi:hypothetical protein
MLKKWFTPLEEEAPETGAARTAPADHSQTVTASVEEQFPAGVPAAMPAIGVPLGRYSSFDQIYQTAVNKLPRISYNILKVVEMVNSPHLAGMSSEAKRSSLLMALDAASVAVEDVLQDAVLRQRTLTEYEEAQKGRLKHFEQTKSEENAKIQAELDKLTKAHMSRIQANLDEVAREQDNFRSWQKAKTQECERLTDAAGYCVPPGSTVGVNNLAAVLERATISH